MSKYYNVLGAKCPSAFIFVFYYLSRRSHAKTQNRGEHGEGDFATASTLCMI
jgi:hypothetical protein